MGDKILDKAIGFIVGAQKIVGGRLVHVDCKNIEGLKKFYEKNGFVYFNTDPDTGLLQYYKKV